MRFLRSGPLLSLVGATAVILGGGCDKAKDSIKDPESALKEALGIDELTNEQVATIKTEAGWNDAVMTQFKIIKGFKLTDKFKGDLGKTVEIPIPLDIPAAGAGQAASKTPSYSLLKKRTFVVGPNSFTRFEIVSVARYEVADKKLVIDGEKIGAFLDDSDRVKIANKNQDGEYLLVKGQGEVGLAYLTGVVKLQKNDGSAAAPFGGAVVFTTDSPFVTTSGSKEGKFLLAVIDQGSKECQQGGMITATAPGIGAVAAGTPTSTQGEIPCIGVLDNYAKEVGAKGQELGKKDEADKLFKKVNTVVTDFLGAWKAGAVDLTFVQPPAPKAPEVPPVEPTPPAPPADSPIAKPAETPTPPVATDKTKVDPTPPASSPILRPNPDEGYGVNLGCTYTAINATTGISQGLVGDVAKYDDYPATKGWRFFGDVRVSNQNAAEIFGAAAATKGADNRNPDVADGYCLLTTGNQLFNKYKSPIYDPKDGKTSEIWQKIAVPATATGIQIRTAFFSMEYPTYVGTSFNDNFYVKFDESPYFIAQGSLNDLAGYNDPTLKAAVEKCSTKSKFDAAAATYPCGEWDATTWNDGDKNLTGALWDVTNSTQGPSLGSKFMCGTDAAGAGRCYPGMIQPKVLCAPLDRATETGKTLTLRIGVSDAGDSYYDSALAVDSVVFTSEANPCEKMFTGEKESQATRWDPTM